MSCLYVDNNNIFVYTIQSGNVKTDLTPNDIKQICYYDDDNKLIYYKSNVYMPIILTINNEIIFNYILYYLGDMCQKKINYNNNIKQINYINKLSILLILFESGCVLCQKLPSLKCDVRNGIVESLIIEDPSIISITSCDYGALIQKKDSLWYYGLKNNIKQKCEEWKTCITLDFSDNLVKDTNEFELVKILDDKDSQIKHIYGKYKYFIIQYINKAYFLGFDSFGMFQKGKEFKYFKFFSSNKYKIKKISLLSHKLLILTRCGRIYSYSSFIKELININPLIVDIWIHNEGKSILTYLTYNGKLYRDNILISSNKDLILVNDIRLNLYWSCKNHSYLPYFIQKKVLLTLLLFKFIYSKLNIKLPKPVSHIIISFIAN